MATLFGLQLAALPPALQEVRQLTSKEEFDLAERKLRTWLAESGRDALLSAPAFEHLLYLLTRLGRRSEAYELLRVPPPGAAGGEYAAFAGQYAESLHATGSSPIPLARRARFLELADVFRSTRGAAGLIAECGCFRGLSAHFLCQLATVERPGFDGAGMHIFDSFAGLSEPMPEDAIEGDSLEAQRLRRMSQPGAFAAALAEVRGNLSQFPAVAFHAGWIPYCFDGLEEGSYRFVHVDVDLHDPTYDSFDYFFPRLAPGGAIVSDDYTWPGCRKAIDTFCAERNAALELTPGGQALVRRVS